MEKITSKEIARLAGVSVSTVSIVLNNKPGVGPETRERILSILATHGIFPKPSGVVSVRGIIRFCKIVKHGHILNERHNVFISEYIDGVIEEAKKHDLSIEVSTYQDIPISAVAGDLARATNLDGCILLCTELSEEDLAIFSSLPIPHVFLDAIYPYFPDSFVTMDNYGMVFEAIRFLKEYGHTRIGMLTSSGCSNFVAREEAFIASLKRLDLPYEKNLIFPVQSTHTGSYKDIKALLAEKQPKSFPTAFFACNDIVAIGAIRAFQESGFQIPDQISIMGFDDLPASSLFSPPLTTLCVPKIALGRLAVQVLLNKLSSDPLIKSQKYVIGGCLVIRASVKKLL